jgi:hypothetical protein
MQTFLVVLAVVIFILCIRSILRSPGRDRSLTMRDIDRVVHALRTTGTDESFAVVLVPDTAEDDGAAANLQFSIEQGRLGFDWVLNAKRNIRDRDKVVSLIKSLGYICSERKSNNVDYLRCEDARDFPGLAKKILRELYRFNEQQPLSLIVDGFEWETRG